MHESGLLAIWKRKWWPASSQCAGGASPQAKAIQLIDVQSAFYVLLSMSSLKQVNLSLFYLILVLKEKYNRFSAMDSDTYCQPDGTRCSIFVYGATVVYQCVI